MSLSGCEDRPDMVRPTPISMIVDDTANADNNNVVELVAPSADAAARLKKMKEIKKQRYDSSL